MKKGLLFVVVLFLATNFLTAQAPANDNCADATPIALDEVVDYTTIMSTTDGPLHPADGCFGANDSIPQDIWFSYTAMADQVVVISNCGTSGDFDSRMVMYQANLTCPVGPDDYLACNDDGGGDCGVASSIGINVFAGETYLIRLGGFGDDMGVVSEGSGTISITLANGPDNDFCANAAVVTVGENQEYSSLDALTDGPDHPDNPCFGFGSLTAGSDIWYTFTPDFTGSVNWSTCNTGGFDTRLAVYNPGSACPPLDEDLYSCNDDGAGCDGYTSNLFFDVTQGETYLLRLGGFGGASGQGTFNLLEIAPPVPPENDGCDDALATAMVVTQEMADMNQGITLGTTVDATFVSEGFVFPSCLANQNGGEFADVWYTFNTLGNTTLDINLFNLGTEEGVVFYLDLMTDCTTLVDTMLIQGSCLTATAGETTSTIVTGLPEEDITLYVRVITRVTSDFTGEFGFQIIGDVPSSVEDEVFGNAVSISPNPTRAEAVLNMNLQESIALDIEILNTVGQLINKQSFVELAQGQNSLSLDVNNLASGLYFVNLRSDNSLKTLKLVVEK